MASILGKLRWAKLSPVSRPHKFLWPISRFALQILIPHLRNSYMSRWPRIDGAQYADSDHYAHKFSSCSYKVFQ